VAKAHPAAERKKVDKKLVAAHEYVLEMWSPRRVSELSEIVRSEPMYQPLNPSPTEAEFYRQREQAKQEVELEPMTEAFGTHGPGVVVDWEEKSE